MRKIFLLLGLACSVAYSQTPIDYDSTSHITTTNTTDYIPVFRDTPSKALFTMTAENAFPWIYSGGYVRPRTIGYNLMLGTSSNYAYKLYTGGLSYFSDNMTLATGKRFYLGSGSYAYESGSDIHFYSSVAGDNTLANLASVNDTISDFYADTLTIENAWKFSLLDADNLYVKNVSNTIGMYSDATTIAFMNINEGSAFGMYNNYMAWDLGIPYKKWYLMGATNVWTDQTDTLATRDYARNYAGTGGGGVVDTAGGQSVNQAAYWTDKNTLDGSDAIKIYTDSSSFGKYIMVHDSIYYLPFAGVEAGSIWWTNSVTGAIDSANTRNAWFGLEHDLANPIDYRNDTKKVDGHRELKVWYIDDKTHLPTFQYGIAKSSNPKQPGLSPTEMASAMQINHEFDVRFIVEHEKQIQALQKQVDQNKRTVLKQKVKSLEERIETIEKLLSFPSCATTLEHRK